MSDRMADAAQDLRVAVADARDAFHVDMLKASRRYELARERADNRYATARLQCESESRECVDFRSRIRGMSDEHVAQVHAQLVYALLPQHAIRSTTADREKYARHLVVVEDEMAKPYRNQDRSVAV